MDFNIKKNQLSSLLITLVLPSFCLLLYSFFGNVEVNVIILILIISFGLLKILKINMSFNENLPVEIIQNRIKHSFTRSFFYLGTFTLPFLVFRIAGLTFSDIFYLISTLLLFLLFLYQKEITYYQINKLFYYGAIIFSIGAILSCFNSFNPLESLVKVFRVLYILFIWFNLSMYVLKSEKLVFNAFLLWLLGVSISGFVAILQLKYMIPYTINHYGRMSSFTGHVSDFGALTSIALVPSLILGSNSRGIKAIIFYLFSILIGLGVILSGSVSGFITVAVGFFVWMTIGKPNIKLILTILLLIGSIIGLFSYQESKGYVTPLSRIQSTTSDGEYGTALHRIETYNLAWEKIKANPFVGRGYDEISNKTSNGYPVHNLFLAALYEGGVLAFLGIIFIVLGILYAGVQSIKNSPSKRHYDLSLALFIAFICALIFGMTAPLLYQRYLWIPAALLLPLYSLSKK